MISHGLVVVTSKAQDRGRPKLPPEDWRSFLNFGLWDYQNLETTKDLNFYTALACSKYSSGILGVLPLLDH